MGFDIFSDQGHRHPDSGGRPAGGPLRNRRDHAGPDCPAAAADVSQLFASGVLLGLLYGVAQLLQTIGLAHTAASISGFLTGLYVVATPLLAGLILKSKITSTAWLATILATVGLTVLSLRGLSIGYGELLTCLAALI